MKAKTIKAVIRKKVNEWLESIEDRQVREMASKNTIVTGGCVASMLLGEKVNDFDIYFRDYATAYNVARYYVDRFKIKSRTGIECRIYLADKYGNEIKGPNTVDMTRIKIVVKSSGVVSEEGANKPYQYFEGSARAEDAGEYVSEVMQDPGDIQDTYEDTEQAALNTDDGKGGDKYRPVFLSTNAITLSGRIQIIIRFFGEPDAIHKNYDFVHCTNYWESSGGELVLRPAALEALLTRELRYVGSRYPICSLIRVRKFVKRNWTINAGQILKMCMQVSQLDLTSVEVLEDQLTGVDVAYFLEVINKVKEKDPTKVNYAYLIEIIDRMF